VERSAASFLVVGLVIGVVAGYGVGFVTYQPQISQLQSDLSKTLSEVGSLQGQLIEAKDNITSLDTQVTELEADYESLSIEYEEFKAEIRDLDIRMWEIAQQVAPMLDLEKQIIKMLVHLERGEQAEFNATLHGLDSSVKGVRDVEIRGLWDEFFDHFNAEEYVEAYAKLADLVERNSLLIHDLLFPIEVVLP